MVIALEEIPNIWIFVEANNYFYSFHLIKKLLINHSIPYIYNIISHKTYIHHLNKYLIISIFTINFTQDSTLLSENEFKIKYFLINIIIIIIIGINIII